MSYHELLKRLSEAAVRHNDQGAFAVRDLLRESREAIEKLLSMRDALETLQGAMLLEFHNSNWLAGDAKRRNEGKRELIERCISILGTSAVNTFG